MEILKKSYDLCILMECNDPSPQYIELKNLKCDKFVYWNFDISYYPNQVYQIINYFKPDHFFCADSVYTNIVRNNLVIPSSFLPYACAPEFFRDISDVSKKEDFDGILLGSVRPERIKLIDDLEKLDVKINLKTLLFKEEAMDEMSQYWFTLNENPSGHYSLLNMRWFEAMAAGTIIFGQKEDEPFNVFDSKYHLYTYSKDKLEGVKEGVSTMLVGHDTGLDDLSYYIEENQKHLRKEHMYLNRAKTILETLNF